MTTPASGSDILIVDNSDDNWKALRYLEEWAEIDEVIDQHGGWPGAFQAKVSNE